MKRTKEVEVMRSNISARQFYTYCRKRLAEKINVNIEDWTDGFETWRTPYQNITLRGTFEDGDGKTKREILTVHPYETQNYREGAYNFILEWKDGIGYMYHVEFES